MDDGQFDAWTDRLVADAREGTPRPEGFVPSTNLWWVDGTEFLGRVQVRHRLTPRLRDLGGHVGYWVAPAVRRRGHATAILAATLPVANALGLECVLVTCDDDNVASRRVIEANGGLFQDRRGVKLRFWVPTA
jgi:predicted acetyltransferase